ncbi:MAG: ComEA family DNA-binding protein [Acidimicrobiales bacterium]
MEPLDPLDQLMRGPAALPLHERVRELARRRRWLVGAAAVGVLAAGVWAVSLGSVSLGSGAADVSLPRANPSAPASAPATTGGPSSTSGPAGSTTTLGGAVVVHVAGAVVTPGLVRLGSGARVADAVAAAGGLRPDADADRLNLAAPLSDGTRVFVPTVGRPDPVPVPTGAASAGAGAGGAGAGSVGTPGPGAPVDINSADVALLDTLPGVGPSTAAAIVAYRSEHGPFASVDDLQDVRGIGPAKFDALRDLVTVGP